MIARAAGIAGITGITDIFINYRSKQEGENYEVQAVY